MLDIQQPRTVQTKEIRFHQTVTRKIAYLSEALPALGINKELEPEKPIMVITPDSTEAFALAMAVHKLSPRSHITFFDRKELFPEDELQEAMIVTSLTSGELLTEPPPSIVIIFSSSADLITQNGELLEYVNSAQKIIIISDMFEERSWLNTFPESRPRRSVGLRALLPRNQVIRNSIKMGRIPELLHFLVLEK